MIPRAWLSAALIALHCLLLVLGAPAHATGEETIGGDEKVRQTVIAHLRAREFDALERLADEYISGDVRNELGSLQIHDFHIGVLLFTDEHFDDHDALNRLMDDWLAAYPNSPTAINAKSKMLLQQAWQKRGYARGRLVTRPQYTAFDDAIRDAENWHDRNYETGASQAVWYEIALSIKRAKGSNPDTFWAIFEEGGTEFPDYDPIYFEMLTYLSPRWYGSAAKQERFVDWVSNMMAERRNNDHFYSQLITELAIRMGLDYITNHYAVDWQRLHRSLIAGQDQFPTMVTLNRFGRVACYARQRELAQAMFDLIGEEINPRQWDGPINISKCRSWLASVSGSPE